MRLSVDLTALHAAARKMGASPVDFTLDFERTGLDPIDAELAGGIELPDLDRVDTGTGLLSFEGRQILLYIQDHGARVRQARLDGRQGNKFHVADCSKLKQMRTEGRYERYVVINNLNGVFPITGYDPRTRRAETGEARLWVCQFCLGMLNYKNCNPDHRQQTARDFDIGEFFATYSSFFSHQPSRWAGEEHDGTYTEDWATIAGRYKADQGFICESCHVDLSGHRRLLHVHHKNGVKTDNRLTNLQALCAACHRNQPKHRRMHVRHADMQLINRLRRQQGVLRRNSWDNVIAMADPGLAGLLYECRKRHLPIPEIGRDIHSRSGTIVATLELVWSAAKQAVAISEEAHRIAPEQGWHVWSMKAAKEDFAKFAESVLVGEQSYRLL